VGRAVTVRPVAAACALAACIALVACAGVLGLRRDAREAFPHRAHVLAGVTCTRCHAGLARDDGPLHLPDTAACVTCHAKPHDARPCLDCHAAPGALDELADARAHLVFDHAKHAGATSGDCMRCHVGVAEGDAHLRPPMVTCFRCHDHDAARDARRCDACHKNLEDARTLPETHLAHDGDWLREHGTRAASSGELCASCHRERFCADCHGKTVPVLPAAQHFADPFSPTIHRAGFAARHALEARAQPGACATCHAPARCEGCHQAQGVAGDGRRSPHPPGWVGPTAADNAHGREARRDPSACASCHDGAGQALCVSCHRVGGVGGDPHPPGWSSRLPATAMPCRMCHPIGSRP
jgi:hypothetical protein